MMQLREIELQYRFTAVTNQSYIRKDIKDLIQDMLVTIQLQIFCLSHKDELCEVVVWILMAEGRVQ
jgi:hypothetical protein